MDSAAWMIKISPLRPLRTAPSAVTALILLGIFLTACTRTASTSPITATDSTARVSIERVQVNQGTGIYISGTSTIPEGECVQTELLADDQPVDWWPKDICVEVSAGRWEILVGLGRDNAPARLEPGLQYEIHAWWPDQPEETSTRFPFDLDGPPQP